MMMMLTKIIFLIIPVMISVAFITLAERKVLSLIGIRQGPNKVSFYGIMQPIADAMKLANKAVNSLSNFSLFTYYISVLIMLFCSLMIWSTVSSMETIVSWKTSLLLMMLVLGVSSMKAILAGWSTWGKYPLIGSMRTVSQMVSYESVIYLCLLTLIWMTKNFSVKETWIQEMTMLSCFLPIILMFWIPAMLAELNRTPYDFSEGESELVSGFNTEFGSSSFTMIFLSEYSNIIFFTGFSTIILFSTKSSIMMMSLFSFFNYWMIWIRSTLPRMRFDKFMQNAWKFYIPFTTVTMLIVFTMI